MREAFSAGENIFSMAKPGYISFDTPKQKSPPLSEGNLIVFEECRPGQVYTAVDGSTMKILEQTRSGRYLIFLNDKKAGIIENNPDEKYTDERLRELIKAHGFVLSSEGVQGVPRTGESSVTPVSNVVSLEDAREKTGQLGIAPEGIEANKAVSEAEGMLADMEAEREGVMKNLKEAVEGMRSAADLIKDEQRAAFEDAIARITEEATIVYDRFLAAEAERNNAIPDESYLKNQKGLLANAQAFDIEAQMLLDKVQDFLESLESQDKTVQTSPGVSANSVHSASSVGIGDGANPHEQKKSNGGDGGDGTESPVEAVLRDIRQHVMEIIAKINTIEEYQQFRDGMATVPARDDKPERRVFISMQDIRNRLGRRLEEDEVQLLNQLERDIEMVTRKKKNDIAKGELRLFSESTEGSLALAAYEEILMEEWEILNENLDKTVFGKDLDTEQRIDFWKKEFYSELETSVLEDMQAGCGLDRARAELIFEALLRRMTADWQYRQNKSAKSKR